MAITCVELSASATVVFQGVNSALHADFPLNPEDAYDKMEVEIFKKLHYSRLKLVQFAVLHQYDSFAVTESALMKILGLKALFLSPLL